jgi:hypothetical protein
MISLDSFQDDSFDIKSFINTSLDSSPDASTLLYSLLSLGDKLSDGIDHEFKFTPPLTIPPDQLVLEGSFEIDPCFADLKTLHKVKENMIRTKEALKEAENWSMFAFINQ